MLPFTGRQIALAKELVEGLSPSWPRGARLTHGIGEVQGLSRTALGDGDDGMLCVSGATAQRATA